MNLWVLGAGRACLGLFQWNPQAGVAMVCTLGLVLVGFQLDRCGLLPEAFPCCWLAAFGVLLERWMISAS